jgi:hypothetical protein
MALARFFGFLFASFLLSPQAPKTQVYRNDEFGITVSVPKGTLLCLFPEDQHDHGPVFLIGDADQKACHDMSHDRYVLIFASYNAIEETKKVGDFLKEQCTGVGGGPCRPAPKGLSISGMATKAARVNRADGWIDIIVVTQAGKPDPAFDSSVPSINYDLGLHTTAAYLDEDLRIFRAVLSTVRISPSA